MGRNSQRQAFPVEDLNSSSRLVRYFPAPVRPRVRQILRSPALLRDFAADYREYLTRSSTAGFSTYDQVYSRITATYHNIEKGLAQPDPRPGFGRDNLRLLLDLLVTPGLDLTAPPVVTARHVLRAYLEFNRRVRCDAVPFREEIEEAVRPLHRGASSDRGGLRHVTKAEIQAATAGVSDSFFLTRHSVRQYSGEPVDMEDIVTAINAALKAPAVCNRQNAHVYVADDPATKSGLLEFQGGSRGFGHQLDKVLIVTTRLGNFWASGERHQAWVDGGLFSMALIYALHAQGLGTVALNWSRSARDTAEMRRMTGMEQDEVVIMLIGLGHLPDHFTVPVSHRRDVKSAYSLLHRLSPS